MNGIILEIMGQLGGRKFIAKILGMALPIPVVTFMANAGIDKDVVLLTVAGIIFNAVTYMVAQGKVDAATNGESSTSASVLANK